MRWEDVPKVPDDSDAVSVEVPAPACPVDNGATVRQVLISLALVVFMGWLALSAFTSDPIPWIPAILAVAGVAGGLFVFAGVIRSRIPRR